MRKRFFLGIPVSHKFQILLDKSISPLKILYPEFRWVPKENFHITVCFIGELDIQDLKIISQSVKAVVSNIKQFNLRVNSFLLAPSKKPRMIWSGFDQSEDFAKLVLEIESELSKILVLPDYRKNNKPLPHITLARFKTDDSLQLPSSTLKLKLPVDSIMLFESKQSENGPYYIESAEFLLNS